MTRESLKSVHIDNQLVEKIHIEPQMALTANQKKLILYLASLVREEDDDFAEVTISIADYFRLLNIDYSGSAKKTLERSLLNIGSKCFFLPCKSGEYKILCRWLSIVEIDYEKNLLHLKLDESLKPYFIQIGAKARTIFQLGYVLQFRRAYTIDLYLYACRFKNLHTRVLLPMQEALIRFGNGKYKKPSDLMRHVINPAVEEINEKSDLIVKVDLLKTDKKTSHICFHIFKKRGDDKINAEKWKEQCKVPEIKEIADAMFESHLIDYAQRYGYVDKNDVFDFDPDEFLEKTEHLTKDGFLLKVRGKL